ncbi:hypothetical protein HYW17_04455 [Candidatus Uhrbacteria bacterium]|nr:hypothetical protein [Candidatus Uhrbacteria bacterium]
MQYAEEQLKTERQAISLKRRFDAMKALEQWKRQHGEKLKNWDFVAVLRHWREQHK